MGSRIAKAVTWRNPALRRKKGREGVREGGERKKIVIEILSEAVITVFVTSEVACLQEQIQ